MSLHVEKISHTKRRAEKKKKKKKKKSETEDID